MSEYAYAILEHAESRILGHSMELEVICCSADVVVCCLCPPLLLVPAPVRAVATLQLAPKADCVWAAAAAAVVTRAQVGWRCCGREWSGDASIQAVKMKIKMLQCATHQCTVHNLRK